MLRERLLQREGIAVRITQDVVKRRVRGGDGLRTRPERIFIAREFNGVAHAVLAFEFRQRLTGLIRRQPAYAGRGKRQRVATRYNTALG